MRLERADLQQAQELLFALPCAGEADELRWGQRMTQHFKAVASGLKERLEQVEGPRHRHSEEARAKLELLGVVAERLEERARELDPGLADAMARLRAHEAGLFGAALQAAPASGEPELVGGLPDEGCADAPAHGQAAAAAAAAASPGPRGGEGATRMSWPSCPSEPPCSQLTPEAQGSSPPASPAPGARPPACGRGDGAGPQQRGRAYASLHRDRRSGTAGRPAAEVSLQILKGTIRAVYLSKQEHDKEALPADPPETMERHLLRYLGARHRAQEARDRAGAILSAVQKHAGRDIEVAIFGKILQNKLPEQPFIHVDVIQEHVEEKLVEFLRQDPQYREAIPREGALKDLRRCGVPLERCMDIAQDMYDPQDCEVAMRRLGQLVPRFAEARAQGHGKFPVPYRGFLQSLQLVWVHRRECQLRRFTGAFGELDRDGDGVLSGSEVRDLAARLADVQRSAPGADCDEEAQEAEEAIIAELQAACGELLPELRGCPGATFGQCVELFRDVISLCHSLDELQASLGSGA